MLSRTFGVCRRHGLALAGLALLSSGVPMAFFLGTAVLSRWTRVDPDRALDVGGVVMLTLWAPLTIVQVGAATSGTLRAIRGEPFRLGAAIGAGLRRAPSVFLTSSIAGLAVLVGLSVLIAPGLVALAALSLAVPVVVEERVGAPRALMRSLDLSSGSHGALLGVVTALGAVSTAATWGPIAATIELHPAFGLVYPTWLALFAPLPAIGCAVAYAELRERKEGRSTVELARVFE